MRMLTAEGVMTFSLGKISCYSAPALALLNRQKSFPQLYEFTKMTKTYGVSESFKKGCKT